MTPQYGGGTGPIGPIGGILWASAGPADAQSWSLPSMRRLIALALAAVLLGLLASPVAAAGTQRTWRAGLGSGSVNGRGTLTAFTDGTGVLDVSLKSLRRSSTYRLEIRKGGCSTVGKLLAKPGYVRTGTNGAVIASRPLSMGQMNAVWGTARTGSISLRIASGGSVKCGYLTFYRATRVRIPGIGIDMPVVPGPSGYPYCNVAMYQKVLSQPTEPGVLFIFAHARKGMFLPLLNASKINNGASLLGRTVYVYASNSVVHVYTITKVRRHVKSIQSAVTQTTEKLWLQTSEGPNTSYPKLVIEADRTGTQPTTYKASHPTPHIVHCG